MADKLVYIKGQSSYLMQGDGSDGQVDAGGGALPELLEAGWIVNSVVSAGDGAAYVWLMEGGGSDAGA